MNYGLYLSASGAISSMHRQDVLANNLANINTVGFKPDVVDARQRLPERLESSGAFSDPQLLLEQLGGGLFAEPTRTAFTQGGLEATGNDLDLAISGEGFLVASDGDPSDPANHRLTRDGRLTLNSDGELVLASSGLRVLNENGRPITLDDSSPIAIDEAGNIIQNRQAIDQLHFVDVPEPGDLRKAGESMFRLQDGVPMPAGQAPGRIRQGFIESSAVDPILTLNSMINAAKAAQANLKMMQYHDQLLGQTFNTFGRVS